MVEFGGPLLLSLKTQYLENAMVASQTKLCSPAIPSLSAGSAVFIQPIVLGIAVIGISFITPSKQINTVIVAHHRNSGQHLYGLCL